MRNTVLAVITLVIVLLSANATAAGGEATQALAEQAAVQRELARANAPVRNPAEFKRYLADHRGPSSPFHALSRGALSRFSNSLTFTDHGLASFDDTDLRRELSASQVHALLRVFGVEDANC